MKVALIGTRGVPARYGGFETAVEQIGRRLASRGYEVTVYCRNPGQRITSYEGMHLVNLPAIRHRAAETLSHTTASVTHAIIRDRPDVVLLLNAANAPLLKPLKYARIPTAIHLDGLESRRQKWRGMGASYFQWAERASIRWGQRVIADADAIADYVLRTYGRECVVIPYGADVIHPGSGRLDEVGAAPGDYHLVVARIEPENHVLEAVLGFRASAQTQSLLVVGSAPYSRDYVERVRTAAHGDSRIRLLGAVYDQALVDQLYANCVTYIHGHSVGGTNPSLLRAMGAGAPVLGFDVEFTHEVTAGSAYFWTDELSLAAHLDAVAAGERDRELMDFADAGRARVEAVYQWDTVTDRYEDLVRDLKGSAA